MILISSFQADCEQWKYHALPNVTAEVDKGEAEVGHEVVADEAEGDLTKERLVEVGVNQVGDQGEEEKERGDQEGRWIEDKGEFLPVLLLLTPQTDSESFHQVCLGVSGRVYLNMDGSQP